MSFLIKNYKEIYLSVLIFFTFSSNYRLESFPLGLSEILFIPIFFYSIYYFIYVDKNIIKFPNDSLVVFSTLLIIFFIISISMCFSLFNENFKHINMLHNFAAFLYINLIILIFIILNPNYNNFLIFFILISFLITSFFLIYSFFENNFLNRSLFYANTEYRSLFTKNHHQIAFYSSILIFLSAHFLLYLKKKIFLIPLIFFSYLLFISESNGNIFGIIVSIILTLIIFFFIKLKLFKINKYFFIFLLFIIGFSFCYLSFDPEINLFIYKFTMENNNVFFRLDFINFFINKLSLVNILLGHGPGGYVTSELSANHFREAHNTFIDLTIYSGIIPILLLIFVYFKTLSKLIFNNLYILLALLLFLFFYSLTHNIVRYPFYWIFFLFILTVNFNKKTDAN